MKYKIEIVDLVKFDIEAAYHWYEDKEPGTGDRFSAAFEACLTRLQTLPTAYPRLYSNARHVIMHPFPYYVIYYIRKDTVKIIGVIHARETRPGGKNGFAPKNSSPAASLANNRSYL